MKNYPKIYENVYCTEKSYRKCILDDVSTDTGMSTEDYVEKFKGILSKYQKDSFDNLLKVKWLINRFCYKGKPRNKNRCNGIVLDSAFGVFLRKHINRELKLITQDDILVKVMDYFEDFFPHFNVMNPFEDKMEYPYKYVTFEFLIAVHKMPERMDLLEYAEKEKMSYLEFCDYVINYCLCHNDEVGKQEYYWYVPSRFMPYVKVKKI